jgi:hypothetical protein
MRQRLGVAALILLAGVVVCGLGLFALVHRNDPPGVWQNPPLYPDAQDVRVEDFGEYGQLETGRDLANSVHIIKVVTFTATEREDQVVEFYARAFSAGGMRPSTWGRLTDTPKALNYEWISSARSPSLYFLDVITRAKNENETEVEIGVTMFPGY